jgi:flagellar hook-basal body complex protein FliE
MDISALSQVASGMLQQAGSVSGVSSQQNADGGMQMFSDIFDGLVGSVNQTDSQLQGDTLKAAEGELDNPHQLLIDSTKATISMQLLTSVRNDALQAYNDIIKMTL